MHRKCAPVAIYPATLAALSIGSALLLLVTPACTREQVPEARINTAPEPPNRQTVLGESVAISAEHGAANLTAGAQVTIEPTGDRILIRATGEDPQLTFGVIGAAGRITTIYLDIESPAATVLDLFHQVESLPFSQEHVISSPTKKGRNRLLFQITEPRFSGWLQLDPGRVAGEYAIRSLVVFSDRPMSFIGPARSQAELAAAFEASTTSLFAARTVEAFASFQPLKDATLEPGPDGLAVNAGGIDSSLLLPEVEAIQPAIIKVVIVSPVETPVQIFYKVAGRAEYTEAYSHSQPLKVGENTIYLEHNEPETTGQMRLDPGNAPGNYIVKDLEVRATSGREPYALRARCRACSNALPRGSMSRSERNSGQPDVAPVLTKARSTVHPANRFTQQNVPFVPPKLLMVTSPSFVEAAYASR